MNNNVLCMCFIVVVLVSMIGGLTVGYFIGEIPEKNSVTEIIEKERFTTEYRDYGLLTVIHDNELNVTCWYRRDSGSISCIPDNQLNRK